MYSAVHFCFIWQLVFVILSTMSLMNTIRQSWPLNLALEFVSTVCFQWCIIIYHQQPRCRLEVLIYLASLLQICLFSFALNTFVLHWTFCCTLCLEVFSWSILGLVLKTKLSGCTKILNVHYDDLSGFVLQDRLPDYSSSFVQGVPKKLTN